MKKNVIIFVLAALCAITVETSVFFGYQSAKLHAKNERVMRQNRQLREEVSDLEEKNHNLSAIVDSFDNPHHHDYLLSLQCYQALQ